MTRVTFIFADRKRGPRLDAVVFSCTFSSLLQSFQFLAPLGALSPEKASAKLQPFFRTGKVSEENLNFFFRRRACPGCRHPRRRDCGRPSAGAFLAESGCKITLSRPTPPNFIPKIFPKIMFFNISRSRQKSYANTHHCKPARYENTHKSPKIHSTFWI